MGNNIQHRPALSSNLSLIEQRNSTLRIRDHKRERRQEERVYTCVSKREMEGEERVLGGSERCECVCERLDSHMLQQSPYLIRAYTVHNARQECAVK